MKIKILFPQIVIESKIIEVSEDQFSSLCEHHECVDKFVWENMTDQEQQWTQGQKWVSAAIEEGYAGVRKIIDKIQEVSKYEHPDQQMYSEDDI